MCDLDNSPSDPEKESFLTTLKNLDIGWSRGGMIGSEISKVFKLYQEYNEEHVQ